ncbi:hypothetical protein F5I97DRAFT_627702 [Phlebopus sp. FC_14]|nr:hypothetical protein F5I97DRAFT_627702 [Phlebopus sp. FC_14]
MAVVLSSSSMNSPSILLHPPSNLASSSNSFSSSSSSSSSTSCLDFARSSSTPSTRRIRFAPLPDPRRDDVLDTDDTACTDEPQPEQIPLSSQEPTSTDASISSHQDLEDGFVSLAPCVSTDSNATSTSTIRDSSTPKKSRSSKLFLRTLPFLRRSQSPASPSPIYPSVSLPNTSVSSLPSSANLDKNQRSTSSLPSSPQSYTAKLPRISAEDVLTLGTISFFRARSGSASSARTPPPPTYTQGKPLQRWASTGSGAGMKLGTLSETQSNTSASEGEGANTKKRRPSSIGSPGAGGGRHASSNKMLSSPLAGSSVSANGTSTRTTPTSPQKRHVKMLNGRVYGVLSLVNQNVNPFASARDEPEFVEWGYGGMGSVQASAGVGSDMWRGLQRGETGGALLGGASNSTSGSSGTQLRLGVGGDPGDGTLKSRDRSASLTSVPGGGRGGLARRPWGMSNEVSEGGMGNVGAGGEEEDGSGMGWVKRRRAERAAREAQERAEREAQERADKDDRESEGRKSGESTTASMSASTMSTSTATTSPLASTSTSVTDLELPAALASSKSVSPVGSPPQQPVRELDLTPTPLSLSAITSPTGSLPSTGVSTPRDAGTSTPKDGHVSQEHHVLTAVRISPRHSHSSHTHARTPSHHSYHSHHSQVDTQSQPQHTLLHRGGDHFDEKAMDVDREEEEEGEASSPVDTEETNMSASMTSSSSSSSRSEEKDGNDEEEDDEEDDDVGEMENTQTRKTSLGAGVEKVSRHVDG